MVKKADRALCVTLSFKSKRYRMNMFVKKISLLVMLSYCMMASAQLSHEAKENGYEYVDLGLSVLWATCNVGATSPDDCGDYFAWGETMGLNGGKTSFTWMSYKWCNGTNTTLNKYCTSFSYGMSDYMSILVLKDDVANVKWGGTWRMPTKDEQEELRKKCTWTWFTKNNIKGYKIIGPNGNSIFLPAAGYPYEGSVKYAGSIGFYWSSSLYPGKSDKAFCFSFDENSIGHDGSARHSGSSVRPVCPRKQKMLLDKAGNITGKRQSGINMGHEYVDLGLSVKWATCNVGAKTPEEFGNYFAWGETDGFKDGKPVFNAKRYKWYINQNQVIKYNDSNDNGIKDNRLTLAQEDDVANAKWGGTWRMPTEAELVELMNKCKWKLTIQNGVEGYKAIGPNGNSIFIPAAGYRKHSYNDNHYSRAVLWSSSLYKNYCAHVLELNTYGIGKISKMVVYKRFYGLSVRPVCL